MKIHESKIIERSSYYNDNQEIKNKKRRKINTSSYLLIGISIIIIILEILNIVRSVSKYSYNKNKQEFLEQISIYTEKDYDRQEELEKIKSKQLGSDVIKYGTEIILTDPKTNYIYLVDLKKMSGSKIGNIGSSVYKFYYDGKTLYAIPYINSSKGVYKLNMTGNVEYVSDKSIYQISLFEDKIMYLKSSNTQANKGFSGRLCMIDRETANAKINTIDDCVYGRFKIIGNKIFYNYNNEGLYSVDIDGNNKDLILEGQIYPLYVADDFIVIKDVEKNNSIGIFYKDSKEIKYLAYDAQIYEDIDLINIVGKKDIDDDFCSIITINLNNNQVEQRQATLDIDDGLYYFNSKYVIYKKDRKTYFKNLDTNQTRYVKQLDNCTRFFSNLAIDYSKLKDNSLKIIFLNNLYELEIPIRDQ